MTTPAPTPMMAQYLALKASAPDCLLFYRMGDFFELFFEDAAKAAADLDIALTTRGEHLGQPIPMCGVPAHSHEGYLARLIKAGHRVAIAEQTETPEEAKRRGGKTLVSRGIVRIVSPGTLTEETLLDARAANWLAAVGEAAGGLGLAACDISTGRFEIGPVARDALEAEIARLNPAELIAQPALAATLPDGLAVDKGFDSATGERRLKEVFGVATLDGWGAFTRAELAAAGALLEYLDRAGQGNLPFLQPPVRRAAADHMMIDAASRESLEITATAKPARRDRPYRHRRRRAHAGGGPLRPAGRAHGDRGAARSRYVVSRRSRSARPPPRRAQGAARCRPRARQDRVRPGQPA
jgi:DNA mismatch repair protein MutS